MKLVTFFGLVTGSLIFDAFTGDFNGRETAHMILWVASTLIALHINEKISE